MSPSVADGPPACSRGRHNPDDEILGVWALDRRTSTRATSGAPHSRRRADGSRALRGRTRSFALPDLKRDAGRPPRANLRSTRSLCSISRHRFRFGRPLDSRQGRGRGEGSSQAPTWGSGTTGETATIDHRSRSIVGRRVVPSVRADGLDRCVEVPSSTGWAHVGGAAFVADACLSISPGSSRRRLWPRCVVRG